MPWPHQPNRAAKTAVSKSSSKRLIPSSTSAIMLPPSASGLRATSSTAHIFRPAVTGSLTWSRPCPRRCATRTTLRRRRVISSFSMGGSAVTACRRRGSSLTSCAWRMACSRSTGTSSRTRPRGNSRAAASRCSAINSRLNHCPVTSDLHFRMFPVGFSDVAPKYLAEGRHRHVVAKIDLLRNLEAGQECLAVRDEFGLVDGTAGLQFDRRDDDFTPLRIGRAYHGGHFDGGMPVENLLDVVGKYVLAAADDHVLLAIDDIEVAFLV